MSFSKGLIGGCGCLTAFFLISMFLYFSIFEGCTQEASDMVEEAKRKAREKREKYLKENPEPEERTNLENYNKINTRMTYDQVIEIIGYPDQELSRADIPGTPLTIMYMWKQQGTFGNCTITIQSGLVVMKAQFGLN